MDRDLGRLRETGLQSITDSEVVLTGGEVSRVVRKGDTVRRPVRRWSEAVHELLKFLDTVGFEASPRLLGIDETDREILSWIPGQTILRPWPAPFRSPDGLAEITRLLLSYHTAVRAYSPSPGARWWIGKRALQPGELICHGDVTPWNVVWRDGRVVALIDWDFAEPAPPLFDLAKFAFHAVPMRDDQYFLECGLQDPTQRRDRVATICDAYGLQDANTLLDAVDDYLTTDLVRMSTFGMRGVDPWSGFVSRGLIVQHSQLLRWFRANRNRMQPS